MKTVILTAIVALAIVSCEKPSSEVDSKKLSELEKKAAEAVERQEQLEAELAEQKILAERDAIERERALIEQERIAMEDMRDAENAAAANELERRQAELMERERKIFETQRDLDSREQQVTGLESQLSERELELAGREPLDALPPIEKTYVSGPTGDYNNFYEPLGAYGSWFQTRDYGYVYQPSVVRDSSWRPYTRGRWAFTNQGWTWVSNEPFGWACYHYGRWALLRNVGWVWVPGSEWAPAWVTWRESPGHIGWAPLPPETLGWSGHSWDSSVESRFVIDNGWFSFISYNHFGNDIHRHCLPVSQNIVIYRNTINITHYVVRDRRVFVGGPRYRNVCDRIGRDFPIHRLRLDQSPDFGRGGRRLNSQFRGNELQVVAPRMDADWNRALRPTRVSRDLGEVVVDRSKELPEDVRKQYRDRRNEEDTKAQVLVNNAGGRESFEKERKSRLEKGREEVARNEPDRRTSREPREEIGKEIKRPEQPPVTENPKPSRDDKKRPNDRGSKRPVTETPTVSNPEIPAITDTKTPTVPNPEIPAVPGRSTPTVPNPEIPEIPDTRTPTVPNPEIPSVPRLTDVNLKENLKEESKSNRSPRGVVPKPPVIENNPSGNRDGEPSTGLPRTNLNETTNRPQLPPNRDADLQSEADKKAARDTRQQQDAVREEQLRAERALKLQLEESARLQRLETLKTQQKQEQLEQVQRQQQEKQEKLNEQLEQQERAREQKEQGDKLRELQNKQELERKEQLERVRAQQEQREQAREQQDKLREQQAQQELARKQQAETQSRLKEQQEQLRAQQEQQEKLRAQQEQLRAQQEQQEKLRAQQEQLRAQQEQQERARAQQEQLRAQQDQQERMRAQQEQQERARQQQEEAQRRIQEQQEQQQRMRAQQEQQERARQQQEESQRRAEQQQQEQLERARQQEEQKERARKSQGR